jgi:hypothetical protein
VRERGRGQRGASPLMGRESASARERLAVGGGPTEQAKERGQGKEFPVSLRPQADRNTTDVRANHFTSNVVV